MDNSLIKRQDAIDVINILYAEHRYRIPGKRETYSQYNEAWQDALDRAEGDISRLPSARPERTGHWIEMGQNEDGTHNICCGVCGKFKFKSKGHANSYYTKNKYKFCGGCGAKMEVEHETD